MSNLPEHNVEHFGEIVFNKIGFLDEVNIISLRAQGFVDVCLTHPPPRETSFMAV